MKLIHFVAASLMGLVGCAQRAQVASSSDLHTQTAVSVPLPKNTPYDNNSGARDAYLKRFGEGYVGTRTTGCVTTDCQESEPYADAKRSGYFDGQDAAGVTTVTVAFLTELQDKKPSIEVLKRTLGPDLGTVSMTGEDDISYNFAIRIEGTDRAEFLKNQNLPSADSYFAFFSYTHGVFTGFHLLPDSSRIKPNHSTEPTPGAVH